MKNKNNLIIGLLIVLVLGLTAYIVYDKVFVEDEISNIQDNDNNQEENNNSNVQDNNNQEENLNVDFNKLFKEAEKLYALFTPYYYVELDRSEANTKIYNGNKYYLVQDKNFNFKSLDEMKTELSKFFSIKIVNQLIYNGPYVEFNGKLYRHYNYAQDSYGDNVKNIKTNIVNDNLVVLTYNASFLMDGPNNEVRTTKIYYIVSKNESGNWIFENFELSISNMR